MAFERATSVCYRQVLNAQTDDETLGGGERWAFVGIALMPWDRAMADCLKKQVRNYRGFPLVAAGNKKN